LADNVDITAGTGTTIATDDCTTGHVQLVKLAYGADGNRTQVAADADGLLVNLGTNNDVTVTGTVTANLAAGTNNIGDVDVLSVPAPLSTTGNGTAATALRVSLANDSTGIVALTTSSAAIGKLAANDGVDVGDVTINNSTGAAAVNIQDGGNSITVDNGGTFATQLTTATATGTTTMQNAVSATGNGTNLTVTGYGSAVVSITGTFTATVTFEGSTDAGTTWTGVTATQMGTSAMGTTATAVGQYRLNVAGLDLLRARVTWTSGTSITAIGRATNAVNASKLVAIATSSIAKAEDAASADADIGVPALAVRKATPANTSSTDGDYEFLQMSAGRLWTSATIDAALPAGTNAIGKLAANSGVDIGDVDVLTMPNVTLAATTNTIEVVGDVAHDTGVGGNPVQVAGAACAMADSAPGNRVSAATDVTRLATSLDGGVFVHPHGPQIWSYHLDTSTAQTDASVHAAPGAGLSLYVTDIVISLGAATALNVFFEEGATKVLGPYYLEAINGRGMHLKFGTPKKITANTALTITTSASVAQCVDVTGFVAPG